MQQHLRCPGLQSRFKSLCQLSHQKSRASASVLMLAASAVFSACAVADDSRKVDLKTLAPTPEHRQATAGILQLMQRYHYKRVRVGDQLSEQIFDRYLESLDPQKSFLMGSDAVSYTHLTLPTIYSV